MEKRKDITDRDFRKLVSKCHLHSSDGEMIERKTRIVTNIALKLHKSKLTIGTAKYENGYIAKSLQIELKTYDHAEVNIMLLIEPNIREFLCRAAECLEEWERR